MLQIFKIGSFWVYFWSNEGVPLEPVHILQNILRIIEACHEDVVAKWIALLPFPTSQSQNPQIVHPAIQNSNDKNFITFVPVKDQIPADRKATILRQAIYLTS